MAHTPVGSVQGIEEYRSYLHLLAEARLDHQLRGKLDPSDIVQETLLHAHQAWNQFHGTNERELAAWLRQILARNLLHSVRDLHRAKRDIDREVPLQAVIDESANRLEHWLADAEATPCTNTLGKERLMEMSKAIQDLPDKMRQAVVLYYWEECTLTEIGEYLGCSGSTVAGLLRHGLQQLRKQLASPE
jgi:RNA polymerase sigma-70 factor (ECF subfamily)